MDFELIALCEEILVILKKMKEDGLITGDEYLNHTKEKIKFLDSYILAENDFNYS